MELLRFFESIRTDYLDLFFSAITHFGEETIFIIIGIIIFWCINKKKGYYILFVGFMGVVANQFLKITFRVPRPWVKDPDFTIVEAARSEATGYSFPSGHTQVSVGTYGGIARATENMWLRVICIVLCTLVPLSRLYLGVHTPADVGVSLILAVILVFALYPTVNYALEKTNRMRVLLAVIVAISAVYLIYVETFDFPIGTDSSNLLNATENAYKILGAMLGVWAGYEIDEKFIKFDTKAVWWVQVIKVVAGILPILLIKSLKAPLNELFSGLMIAHSLRYFLITLFACGIWPFTFKFFEKMADRYTNTKKC